MPTERFFNLPQEKRKRIMNAAITVMKEMPAEALSINRIIQLAEIPRGSFYQYFADKKDLITYVIERMQTHLFKRLRALADEEKGDLFRVAKTIFAELLSKGLSDGYHAFFINILPYVVGNTDYDPCMERFCPHRLLEEMRASLSLDGYRRKDAQFVQDLSEMLFSVMKDSFLRILAQPEQKEEELSALERKLAIIEAGVYLPGKEISNVEIQC